MKTILLLIVLCLPTSADTIYVNNGAGIRQLVFDSNRIIDNDQHAIALYGHLATQGIDQLSFVGNTITNNGGDAIQNTGGMPNIEWSGNSVSGNGNNFTPTSTGFTGNAKPTVTIVAASQASLGQAVPFSIQYSDDGAPAPAEVLWDLGEGLPVTTPYPSVVFRKSGIHTVTVLAWDAQGRAAHAQHVITITSSP